uniref:MLX-interacting protein n=1 Tax=Tigriopus kingsejongensis TaxID=1133412 RepID=A0A343U6Y5_9MAXI|nr:MLX-interacting protein [Tigriopus kingsejongensis]
MAVVRHKEAIHSGHFMISDFEAEAEAEEDISVPQAEEGSNIPQLVPADEVGDISPVPPSLPEPKIPESAFIGSRANQALSIIDISLNKLFQSMSIAYRHKLTSPKWNKFRGLKLRWKDKIRLNNVIWRCWHMQFIKGRNQLLCAFANPLEIDNHDHTEGSTVLEGKYWKRQLQTVTSEYKQWRLFYKHRGAEHEEINGEEWEQLFQHPFQLLEGSKDDASLIPDEENFMEALFNSIAQDPNSRSFMGQTLAVPFPNPREMHRNTTNADFIQPGLVQLQPNLEDFFSDMDGINQLPDWLTNRLPSIQEGPLDGHAPPAGNIHSKPSSNPSGGVQPMYTTINISDVEANDLTRNSVMASLQPAATTDQQYNEQVQSQGEQPYPTTSFAGTVETPSASKYNIDATSSAGASRYPGPISHPKRNSPKHRILCQREYAPDYNYSPSSPSGLSRRMSNSTSQYQSSGLVQASSPYHLPVSTASSDPPGAMPSIGKARSFSNPPMSRPSWKHSPAVEANSELVQLLRSNSKTPRTLPAIESPPVTEPLALRVPSEPDPSPRAALMIPPPSPQSHPQPSFTIGAGPSSRSTKSPPESSVGAFSSLSFQAEAVLLPIRGNNDFEVESEDSHPETKLKGVVDL